VNDADRATCAGGAPGAQGGRSPASPRRYATPASAAVRLKKPASGRAKRRSGELRRRISAREIFSTGSGDVTFALLFVLGEEEEEDDLVMGLLFEVDEVRGSDDPAGA
jgi:hypothetical protein